MSRRIVKRTQITVDPESKIIVPWFCEEQGCVVKHLARPTKNAEQSTET